MLTYANAEKASGGRDLRYLLPIYCYIYYLFMLRRQVEDAIFAKPVCPQCEELCKQWKQVGIRQHTSAYVSIRQHTSAYVSIRQHTYAQSLCALNAKSCASLVELC
jgi:hypothetical protein